jgi:hypothetical protein
MIDQVLMHLPGFSRFQVAQDEDGQTLQIWCVNLLTVIALLLAHRRSALWNWRLNKLVFTGLMKFKDTLEQRSRASR